MLVVDCSVDFLPYIKEVGTRRIEWTDLSLENRKRDNLRFLVKLIATPDAATLVKRNLTKLPQRLSAENWLEQRRRTNRLDVFQAAHHEHIRVAERVICVAVIPFDMISSTLLDSGVAFEAAVGQSVLGQVQWLWLQLFFLSAEG